MLNKEILGPSCPWSVFSCFFFKLCSPLQNSDYKMKQCSSRCSPGGLETCETLFTFHLITSGGTFEENSKAWASPCRLQLQTPPKTRWTTYWNPTKLEQHLKSGELTCCFAGPVTSSVSPLSKNSQIKRRRCPVQSACPSVRLQPPGFNWLSLSKPSGEVQLGTPDFWD